VVKCQICDLTKDLCELMTAEKEVDGLKITYCCENKMKKE
jgi:hypothetical protein